MLDHKTRKAIQQSIQPQTRERKKEIFRAINGRLSKCDHCPFKDMGYQYSLEGEENPYELACGACDNYREMRSLGDRIWNTEFAIEYLLEKGKKLTVNEIFYLLEIGAKKKDILIALNMKYPKQLQDYLGFYKLNAIAK